MNVQTVASVRLLLGELSIFHLLLDEALKIQSQRHIHRIHIPFAKSNRLNNGGEDCLSRCTSTRDRLRGGGKQPDERTEKTLNCLWRRVNLLITLSNPDAARTASPASGSDSRERQLPRQPPEPGVALFEQVPVGLRGRPPR